MSNEYSQCTTPRLSIEWGLRSTYSRLPYACSIHGSGIKSTYLSQPLAKRGHSCSLSPAYDPDLRSPLPDAIGESVSVVEEDCHQQGSMNIDCGPFCVYNLTQRIHDLPLTTPRLPTADLRHAFGQWLRAQCVRALYTWHNHETADCTLRGLFNDRQRFHCQPEALHLGSEPTRCGRPA
ncbi:hypothetical protein BU26DRAFT_308747 [Trematosphaeria pertusa]|uniref:Uncharacterized protein n=1 Tax=Trematosphaeria pertusa TaxID=390896 RepID=A0A6A6IG63_9PLEO|nr:uncharacterized protein BU26DRAFT_308747 [Trematosphaeria pertusa]KAF2248902.1 hypothetical protein BU26DRAFT_308747 [Trematosphaeria pertusa]